MEDNNKWSEVLVQTLNTLSNITHNMGLDDETHFLTSVSGNLRALIEVNTFLDRDEPILNLMQKLLEAGQRSQDQASWANNCVKKPWLQTRTYQVTQELQIQMLKAHQAGWLYYEILHLMLEQRDFWRSSDVLWLLVMASEYIDEHWQPEKVEATITFDPVNNEVNIILPSPQEPNDQVFVFAKEVTDAQVIADSNTGDVVA